MEYAIHGLNVKEGRYSTKRVYRKPTLSKTKLCNYGCYIHHDGIDLRDLVLEYPPLLLIVDMKTKNKLRSIQVLCIYNFIILVITTLMYLIAMG